jgi:hypothetical protein
MSNKKEDDLTLDEKLAEDLLNEADDNDFLEYHDELSELDDLDKVDDLDDESSPEEKNDTLEVKKSIDKELSNTNSSEMDELDELDNEISSLNDELDELENYDDDVELDDDIELDDDLDDVKPDDVEDDNIELDDDIEAAEDKIKKKNALIMRCASGAFVVMVGGFLYNMMFAGELPSEPVEIASKPVPITHKAEAININSVTPSLDNTFSKLDSAIKKQELPKEPKNNITLSKKDINAPDEPTILVSKNEEPNKATIQPIPVIKEKVDIKEAMYLEFTKGKSRADGISIQKENEISTIIGQDNKSKYELQVGNKINYYKEPVTIVSVVLDDTLALLSNGTYIDQKRDKIDQEIMNLALQKEELERNESLIKLEQAKIEKNKAIRLAEEKARREEKLKADEEKMRQEAELAKALTRLNKLADEVEKQKAEDNKPKVIAPKILEGWSVNGEFKAIKNGFVLNGYLIRDADGNFYKMLVGDSHEKFGLIRGYDGNGRFFVGNYYIL